MLALHITQYGANKYLCLLSYLLTAPTMKLEHPVCAPISTAHVYILINCFALVIKWENFTFTSHIGFWRTVPAPDPIMELAYTAAPASSHLFMCFCGARPAKWECSSGARYQVFHTESMLLHKLNMKILF